MKTVKNTMYLNCIIVNGSLQGLFYSFENWGKLGSKRSLCEYITGEYHPESDIEIIAKTESGIDILLKEEN